MGACVACPGAARRRVAGSVPALLLLVAGCSAGTTPGTTGHPDQPSAPATRSGTDLAPSRPSPPGRPSAGTPAPVRRLDPRTRARVPADTRSRAVHDARTFVRRSTAALQQVAHPDRELGDEVAGDARRAVLNSVAELHSNHWHQVGRPRLVSEHVLAYHPHASPPRLTVAACLDTSDVRLVDRAGGTVPNSAVGYRSWNYLTLVRRGAGWVVTDQTFPDDPDC